MYLEVGIDTLIAEIVQIDEIGWIAEIDEIAEIALRRVRPKQSAMDGAVILNHHVGSGRI